MTDAKPSNPKDLIAIDKLPTWLVSPIVRAYDAIAHYLGNVKYGAWNWRGAGARVSVYKSALDRHMDAFMEGEWCDPTDGTPHLANAKACLNIIIDSFHAGKLIDDRPPSNAAELAKVRAEFEALMPKIRERYKDKNPKHWTIADTPGLAAAQALSDATVTGTGMLQTSVLEQIRIPPDELRAMEEDYWAASKAAREAQESMVPGGDSAANWAGWLYWRGGDAPVGPGVVVQYRLRRDMVATGVAGKLRWSHEHPDSIHRGSDIIAWRLAA